MFIVDLEELLAPRRREGHVQLHGELTETETECGEVTGSSNKDINRVGYRVGCFKEFYTPLPLGSKQEKEGGVDATQQPQAGQAQLTNHEVGCVRDEKLGDNSAA